MPRLLFSREDIPTLHYACSSWIKKTMADTRDCLWEYGFVLEYGIIWKSVFTHYPVKLMCFFSPFFMIFPASMIRKPVELNCSGHISPSRIKEALCQNGYLATGIFSA